MWEYLELEDHPIERIEYTDKLEIIKNSRILCLLSKGGKLHIGIKDIINKAKIKDKAGVEYDNEKFINSEDKRFLLNNLIASLNGWRIPIKPTLLGPFRIWIYPNTFRSRIV